MVNNWKEYYFWFVQQYIENKEIVYDLLMAEEGVNNMTKKEFKKLLSETLNLLFSLAIMESVESDK